MSLVSLLMVAVPSVTSFMMVASLVLLLVALTQVSMSSFELLHLWYPPL
jgi:hypothetical protein